MHAYLDPQGLTLVSGFIDGASWALSAPAYIAARPTVRTLVIAPALLAVVVWAGGLGAFAAYWPAARDAVWTAPDPAGMTGVSLYVLWQLTASVAWLTGAVVWSVTAVFAAGVPAVPFMDPLSARVEALDGTLPETPGGIAAVAAEIAGGVVRELGKLLLFVLVQVALLALWFVPGVGFAQPLVALGVTAWFAALNMIDYAAARRGLGFRAEVRFVNAHLPVMLGFGAVLALLAFVPVLGSALALPVGVVGGTRMAARLLAERRA